MTLISEFNRLLGLCRALRLAEKGNLAMRQKPDPEDAARLRSSLDYFIAEYDNPPPGKPPNESAPAPGSNGGKGKDRDK